MFAFVTIATNELALAIAVGAGCYLIDGNAAAYVFDVTFACLVCNTYVHIWRLWHGGIIQWGNTATAKFSCVSLRLDLLARLFICIIYILYVNKKGYRCNMYLHDISILKVGSTTLSCGDQLAIPNTPYSFYLLQVLSIVRNWLFNITII